MPTLLMPFPFTPRAINNHDIAFSAWVGPYKEADSSYIRHLEAVLILQETSYRTILQSPKLKYKLNLENNQIHITNNVITYI